MYKRTVLNNFPHPTLHNLTLTLITKHSNHKSISIVRYYVKLIPPPAFSGQRTCFPEFSEVGGGLIHIVPEIVIYANDPYLPQIGNAEVLNLENREVTSVQGEQWPGGHEEGRGGAFQRGERHRHSTIGTQWQPQSIDSKILSSN